MLSVNVGNFLKFHGEPEIELPDVHAGGTYRHKGSGNVVETAQVLDVGPDAMGIPHVRYKVLVERSREKHTRFEAVRTLNLETFSTHFCEALKA